MVSGSIDPKNTSKSEQRIDAIKELIFGENMVEYDARFQELLETLNEKEKALQAKFNKANAELSATIKSLEKTHALRMDKMDSNSETQFSKMDAKKVDRKALGKMLEQIGQKLQA